jgi:hypothetical protein
MGQVSDMSGALIPKATLTATGPQQVYRAVASNQGEFIIPFVQPGTYTITVEAAGFKKTVRQGVVVSVSQKLNLNFALEVGATAESVIVTAESQGVNTGDASGGMVIDNQQVQNLPMNGRQIYTMLNLTPGVRTDYSGFSGTRGWDETNHVYINGQSGNYNQFALNGAPVSQQNGGGSGTWNIAPSVDAVEEFKVMTNTYDAQYGRANGGTINTILKSGTNQFHGTAFDFWRNSLLDANSYQANQRGLARPFHNQHQFGGTIGGPVPFLRKGTFFFFSFEGWREVMPVTVQQTTITPDMLPRTDGSVDLSKYLTATGRGNIYDPMTTRCLTSVGGVCSTYTRDQFAGNVVPGNRISPIGLKIMKLLPLANTAGYQNNWIATNPGRYQYNQPIIRVDHNFSDKTRFYAMYAQWAGTETRNGSGWPGAIAVGNYTSRSSETQVVDLTHTFTDRFFADFRASFNRMYNKGFSGAESAGVGGATITAASLGLTMPAIPTTTNNYAPEFHSDDSAITSNWIGNTFSPSMFETYVVSPSLTYVLGRHNLHFGGEYNWYHDFPNGIGRPNGGVNFGAGFTQADPFVGHNDGSTIADMLLGYPSWGGVDYNLPTYESYKDYGLFIQDDWKLRKNITLNIGVRYENETSPSDRWGRLQSGMCLTCQNPITSNVKALYPGGVLPNGEKMVNPIMGGLMFQKDRSPYQNTWGIILPKVGASWAVTNKLVMRGGLGMFRALGFELGGTSTWNRSTNYQTSLDGGLTPNPAFNAGNMYPTGATTPAGDTQGLMSGVGDSIWFDGWDRKIPYTYQFSYGFQGELPGRIVWDLEYVGARTKDLRSGFQVNHLTPAQFAAGNANPGYLNQMVANPFYGAAGIPVSSSLGKNQQIEVRRLMLPYPQYYDQVYEWNPPQGYSNYNSMVAKAEKRMSGNRLLSRGLTFTTVVTWSKLMAATDRLNNGLLADPKPTYIIDGGDTPFMFSLSGVYELPIGAGGAFASSAHGLLGQLINRWQLNWIVTTQSGSPVGFPNGYTYTCGTFNIKPSQRSYSSYLNNSQSSCFQSFPQYTAVTQLPRTTVVRNPSGPQEQVGILKQFSIYEGWKLQFRAEAFNFTNSPIFNGPSTGSPNRAITRNPAIAADQPGAYSGYGTIGSGTKNNPRQVQMSLKLVF